MNFKQKKDYAFKEFLKGRNLTEICKDIDKDTNKALMSYSAISKYSSKEKWADLRKQYLEEKKNDIKNELLAEDLKFSRNFLNKSNKIIDLTLNNLAQTGFKDEKAIVQFLKFLEEYKDKIKGIEETINIKAEVISDDEQLTLLKNIADAIEKDSIQKSENLNDYFDA